MSEIFTIALLFLGSLFLFYIIGVPVAFAMGASCIVIWLSPFVDGGIGFTLMGTRLYHGLDSFPLLAIPFYVLLGRLMNHVGMTGRLFGFANSIVGQFRGGLAHVNIVASMLFAGMSGLATADAAGLGRVEYTAMRDHGYDKKTALGVTGGSSLIGPLIPPSVGMIIYAVLSGQSTGTMFLAGIVPGVLMGLLLMGMVIALSYRRDISSTSTFELGNIWEHLKRAYLALLTPVIIIGGLLTGLFTATEAGAIAVLYTVLIGYFAYDELSLSGLVDEIRGGMVETAALTFILAMATVYGLVALQLGLPDLMVELLVATTGSSLEVLLALVVLFLVVGTFMSSIAAMTVLIPILNPVIETAGIDPIHFGIVMFVTLLLGTLTPPFGIILFVLEKVTDATLEEVFRGVVPFYLPILLVLVLVILFPSISTYVPYDLVP